MLDAIGFDPAGHDLVVTGEGTVDRTTATGKAPARWRVAAARQASAAWSSAASSPSRLEGVETVALSGDPARAEADLVALGERLARG